MKGISYNAGVAVAGRVVVNALGLVVLRLLTSMLGTGEFGMYSTIYAYLFFVAIVSDMGLGTLVTREISKPEADERTVVSSLFTLRLVLVCITALVGFGITFAFPYSGLVRAGILITSITILSQSLTQVVMGVFQKYLRIGIVATGDVLTRIVQLCGLVLLLWRGAGMLIPVLWVNAIAEIIHLVFMIVATRRIIPFTLQINVPYWKGILRSAFPIGLSLVFTLLYFKIDTVMLSVMRSPSEVGIYSVAYKVLEIIIFFPAMYIGLVMPLLSRHAHMREEFLRVYRKTFLVLAATGAGTVAILVVAAHPIIRIIADPSFAEAGTVLRVLSLAIGLIFLGNLGGNAIIALNLQRKGIWLYAAGAVFNIIANYVLIPRYGYLGAAWTTVATELLVTVWMFLLIQKSLAYRGVHP